MSENAARVRRAYEERTELKVVPIRLGAEARARLERLEERYGGKRKAVEAALERLEEDCGGELENRIVICEFC